MILQPLVILQSIKYFLSFFNLNHLILAAMSMEKFYLLKYYIGLLDVGYICFKKLIMEIYFLFQFSGNYVWKFVCEHFARMVDVKSITGLPVEEGRIRDAVARQIQQFGALFSVFMCNFGFFESKRTFFRLKSITSCRLISVSFLNVME